MFHVKHFFCTMPTVKYIYIKKREEDEQVQSSIYRLA